jgi:hypothetical protein
MLYLWDSYKILGTVKEKEVKKIKFNHNWNDKLRFSDLGTEQKVFTTIRKHDGEKEDYYKRSIGETFEVYCNGVKLGEAKLISVSVMLYDMIQMPLLMLDTGYTETDDILGLFKSFGIEINKHQKIILLVFEKNAGNPV